MPKGFSNGIFDIAQSSINISKKRLGYSKFKENEDFGHNMVSKLTSAKNNQSHFKTKILENFLSWNWFVALEWSFSILGKDFWKKLAQNWTFSYKKIDFFLLSLVKTA